MELSNRAKRMDIAIHRAQRLYGAMLENRVNNVYQAQAERRRIKQPKQRWSYD
jgi:hypothetical protein